jgi:hypothetical protein
MKLFPRNQVAGIFRGFSEGGLEFHADIVLPYSNEFQNTPMHGQFLLVQLETEDEAVLGRITSLSSEGRLTSSAGEDYAIRAVEEDRPVAENLREQYLKYRVDIRVLGVLRIVNGKIEFAASHRRLPHVGSKVSFLSEDLLKEVAGHNVDGADIGFLAMGEFIYSGNDSRLDVLPWMQVKEPMVVPKFSAKNLVARRTFVFARAGFGKSNLVKLLFSNLYKKTPTVEKRRGREVPVGSIIFDPDGEYYWPDDKGRPGLCDVPELVDKVVVFTPKEGPSNFYGSFVAGSIKLDIRRLRPGDVISIALPPEKQDQQNVRKLKQLNDRAWKDLVDEIYRNGNSSDESLVMRLLGLQTGQEAEMLAARANMTAIVRQLHNPSSQLIDKLLMSLKNGKICVVDISQMRGSAGLILSGIILQKIFDHNQEEFTKKDPQTIPTIAVLEEAQSVLGHGSSGGEGPYVSWVKEGRKYDLGAVLITQQPGSIQSEILSQGDNWFVFHLLSAGDLGAVKNANAHFSKDLLSSLLNEPIPGHGVFWSSVTGKSYPIPLRVLSFEAGQTTQDPNYEREASETYAVHLNEAFRTQMGSLVHGDIKVERFGDNAVIDNQADLEASESVDVLELHVADAIHRFLAEKGEIITKIKTGRGHTYYGLIKELEQLLPETLSDRNKIAFDNVPRLLDATVGAGLWKKVARPKSSGGPGEVTQWAVSASYTE